MNFYAASVALLWTTAMQVSAVSRVRARAEPHPRTRDAAAPGSASHRLLRALGRLVGSEAS